MRPHELDAYTLIHAYAQGCFPMPDEKLNEINWYRPDPRAIIPLNGFHVSRSLRKTLAQHDFEIRFDSAFLDVMRACAKRPETWIIEDFMRVYGELHKAGFAHSVEVFRNNTLVGGIYGVSLKGAFFAESMFHFESNMSKIALKFLVDRLNSRGFTLLECQFLTPHLQSLGALEISDSDYMDLLHAAFSASAQTF